VAFFVLVMGIRGNFEDARNRVTEKWSRGGERKLYKEEVCLIVDLNNFLASWSLRSDIVGRSARKTTFVYGMSYAQG